MDAGFQVAVQGAPVGDGGRGLRRRWLVPDGSRGLDLDRGGVVIGEGPGGAVGRGSPSTCRSDLAGCDRRHRAPLEDQEGLLQRDPARLAGLGRPQAVDQPLQRPAAVTALGQLQAPARGIHRVGQLARGRSRFGQGIECVGRLGPPVEGGQRLGAPQQRGIVTDGQAQGRGVVVEGIGWPLAPQERGPGARVRALTARVRSRPPRRRPRGRPPGGRAATRRGRASAHPCSARREPHRSPASRLRGSQPVVGLGGGAGRVPSAERGGAHRITLPGRRVPERRRWRAERKAPARTRASAPGCA